MEPKTTLTNNWLRAERHGSLTPRPGSSLVSRRYDLRSSPMVQNTSYAAEARGSLLVLVLLALIVGAAAREAISSRWCADSSPWRS